MNSRISIHSGDRSSGQQPFLGFSKRGMSYCRKSTSQIYSQDSELKKIRRASHRECTASPQPALKSTRGITSLLSNLIPSLPRTKSTSSNNSSISTPSTVSANLSRNGSGLTKRSREPVLYPYPYFIDRNGSGSSTVAAVYLDCTLYADEESDMEHIELQYQQQQQEQRPPSRTSHSKEHENSYYPVLSPPHSSWCMDPFVVFHNAIRRELVDMHRILNSVQCLNRDEVKSDKNKLGRKHLVTAMYEWFQDLFEFIDLYLEVEEKYLAPWVLSKEMILREDNPLKVKHLFHRYKDRLVVAMDIARQQTDMFYALSDEHPAEEILSSSTAGPSTYGIDRITAPGAPRPAIGDLTNTSNGRKYRSRNQVTKHSVTRFVDVMHAFSLNVVRYFRKQELRLPPYIKKYCKREDVTSLEKMIGKAVAGHTKASLYAPLLILWIEDPDVRKTWINSRFGNRNVIRVARWLKTVDQSEHKRFVHDIEDTMAKTDILDLDTTRHRDIENEPLAESNYLPQTILLV